MLGGGLSSVIRLVRVLIPTLQRGNPLNKPLSIDAPRRLSLKSQTKIILGKAATIALPQRAKSLAESPLSEPSGLLDKTMMSYLKHRALVKGDETFFERLHQDFWKGGGGAAFSGNCDHRFDDLFLNRQKDDFLALQQLWNCSEVNQIVEFGCNSGLVLNYMTKKLQGVTAATGIEINQHQVDLNRANADFDSRIQFECTDGGDWLLENGKSKTLFVTNGGVLEYFSRERLDEMLRHISQHLKPALFFCVEPVAVDHDWSRSTESIPFGEELSFSHNYTDLFESNGFEIVHQRATDFETWQMVATVAKTVI